MTKHGMDEENEALFHAQEEVGGLLIQCLQDHLVTRTDTHASGEGLRNNVGDGALTLDRNDVEFADGLTTTSNKKLGGVCDADRLAAFTTTKPQSAFTATMRAFRLLRSKDFLRSSILRTTSSRARRASTIWFLRPRLLCASFRLQPDIQLWLSSCH